MFLYIPTVHLQAYWQRQRHIDRVVLEVPLWAGFVALNQLATHHARKIIHRCVREDNIQLCDKFSIYNTVNSLHGRYQPSFHPSHHVTEWLCLDPLQEFLGCYRQHSGILQPILIQEHFELQILIMLAVLQKRAMEYIRWEHHRTRASTNHNYCLNNTAHNKTQKTCQTCHTAYSVKLFLS
jgi:hypothetical protein